MRPAQKCGKTRYVRYIRREESERQIENGTATKGAPDNKVKWGTMRRGMSTSNATVASLSLSLFFSCSHGPMTLYRPFYRLWHSVSHGVVMVSPQKRSFNNLTVSPMYTITGVRTASVWRERNQAAVSSPSKRAPKTMGSHNEQIL